jgi:hypothetical protein
VTLAPPLEKNEEVKVEREELKTYRFRVYHVGCGGEYLSLAHGVSNTFGTRWLNACDKCGHERWADKGFPYVEHRPK